MIAAAALRRRILAGDTYTIIGADLGLSADALRKRAVTLGVKSTAVLGRHRWRPFTKLEELVRRRETKRKAA